MKLLFRIIFKITLILAILIGCTTTEGMRKTGPAAQLTQTGIFYTIDKKYDRAISLFNKAIELDPSYAEAYRARGIAYMMGKGQYNKAMSDVKKANEYKRKNE